MSLKFTTLDIECLRDLKQKEPQINIRKLHKTINNFFGQSVEKKLPSNSLRYKDYLIKSRSKNKIKKYENLNSFILKAKGNSVCSNHVKNDQKYQNYHNIMNAEEDNLKVSFYQQYKTKEFSKKKKWLENQCKSNTIDLNHFLVTGSNFNENRTKQLTINQILHSKLKEGTPRRGLMTSQNTRANKCMLEQNKNMIRSIGIMGVKTSFLDKYKVKIDNSMQNESQYQKNQKSTDFNRIQRRQILCSTKRNPRTLIQPRMIKTSLESTKRQCFFNANDDKVDCRPWSPNKDEQFEKL